MCNFERELFTQRMPPPPPPPVLDEDVVEGDSEALYSMLIAWYMSGYHTGYYQVGMTTKKSFTMWITE